MSLFALPPLSVFFFLIFSHFPSLFPAFPSPFLLSVPTFLVHKSLKKSGQIAYPSWNSHRLSVEIIILPTLLSVFLCVVFRHCSLLPIHLYIRWCWTQSWWQSPATLYFNGSFLLPSTLFLLPFTKQLNKGLDLWQCLLLDWTRVSELLVVWI